MEVEEEVEKVARALKPPRCPKCGEKVDELIFQGLEWVEARFTGEEYINWESLDFEGEPQYLCPKCRKVLFYDENDARRFLQGE